MPSLKQVIGYECWGIFADYDANAPTTEDLMLVVSEELAQELVDLFNISPRDVPIACVDGWEHTKSFKYHRVIVDQHDISKVKWFKQEVLEEHDLTDHVFEV